jgi:hypothetical protein
VLVGYGALVYGSITGGRGRPFRLPAIMAAVGRLSMTICQPGWRFSAESIKKNVLLRPL